MRLRRSARPKSALLSKYRIPVGTPRFHSHFLYENAEDSIQRNISGRQMGVSDFCASYFCSLSEMQMRRCDWAVANRMPVIQQDLCEFSVKDSIVVAHNSDLPTVARQSGLNNSVILLHPEPEPRRASEGGRPSAAHSKKMWVRRGIISAVNSNHPIRHTRK